MEVKIFVQDQCHNCPPAKEVGKQLEEEGFNISYHDIKSVDGLSESIIHDVMTTPSVIIMDDDVEVHAWRGESPEFDDVKTRLG